jgi:hypothetical protein
LIAAAMMGVRTRHGPREVLIELRGGPEEIERAAYRLLQELDAATS